jgi:hypothetical protein
MTDISKSPERNTFQAKSYEEKLIEDPDNRNARAMVEMYQQWREEADSREIDESWQKNNMEYEMRTCDWMRAKGRSSDCYAQNLYAAMCNMRFQKLDVMPILKDELWSASWRSAGGIIANMKMQGDYIDWYCSGMGEGLGNGDPEGTKGYIPEGVVTDEIKEDLKQLGWVPVEWDKD